ncbi:MAG: 4,5-dihydroxyphthalate decarboxylase [Betaproteobacteria bacterium RIFCSPLOWO2_02_FULL_63_19]|nr:MAG: 4,5-dihydroxyphthalate decarboxylase [Betaproteobacteria bacterium RIFCSPLOWO2_02_FULL_63_19]
MNEIDLTISTWDYDRVRALIDGRVRVEGCRLNYIALSPEECFHRGHFFKEFEATEIGCSFYLNAISIGDLSYRAIPVFLSRTFRHSGIYVRSDSGIKTPGDLRGRRVGVPEYQMTAAIWIRGMLKDQFGVDYADINWVEGGLEEWGRKSKIKLTLPPGFPLEQSPQGRSLNQMLVAGDLDAVIGARAPSCFIEGDPRVRRLFDDFKSAEKEYFAQSGIFPIMHCLAIRGDVADRHPWLATSLLKAFEEAKRIADQDLEEVAALKIGLPWLAQELAETKAVMGENFWSYGVPDNRKTLDAMVRYAYEQGVAARPLKMEEVFIASTVNTAKI